MEFKKLLQQGGGVLVIALMVYGSGWQYCLGLIHGLGAGIYFVVPWDTSLGRGFPGLITTVIISGLSYLTGYAARVFSERRKWGIGVHVLAVILCFLGYFMPSIGELFRVPRIAGELAQGHWRLKVAVVLTVLLLYYLAFRDIRKPSKVTHYFIYAVTFLFFMITTFYYSTLLGRAAAQAMSVQAKAEILFSDPEMQRDYGKALFVPIMEKGDELIVARCATEQPSADCKPMIIKRNLIRAVKF